LEKVLTGTGIPQRMFSFTAVQVEGLNSYNAVPNGITDTTYIMKEGTFTITLSGLTATARPYYFMITEVGVDDAMWAYSKNTHWVEVTVYDLGGGYVSSTVTARSGSNRFVNTYGPKATPVPLVPKDEPIVTITPTPIPLETPAPTPYIPPYYPPRGGDEGDADADSDTDTDADADGDADTDTDTDSDADADADSDTDTDADADGDADTDADADDDADADTDSDLPDFVVPTDDTTDDSDQIPENLMNRFNELVAERNDERYTNAHLEQVDDDHWMLLDDDGIPLGMFSRTDDDDWDFEDYIPLGNLPQTSGTKASPIMGLAGAILVATGLIIVFRRKKLT
jgi:LPXTG-motif cell wall-anchored protein